VHRPRGSDSHAAQTTTLLRQESKTLGLPGSRRSPRSIAHRRPRTHQTPQLGEHHQRYLSDDESVSLELTDDVSLHHSRSDLNGPEETRFQLAHSVRPSVPELLKSTKLWKTIGIWASEYEPTEFYFLITCAPICSDLQCLTSDTDRARLLRQLEE
jgi:hypothetical protein